MTPFDGDHEDGDEAPDTFQPTERRVDPTADTSEPLPMAPVQQPVQASFTPTQSNQTQASQRHGIGMRVVALVALVALVFGAIGGGIAGGVAGYTLADDEPAAASTPPANVADTVASQPNSTPASVSDLVARINPAVVTIENTLSGGSGLFGQGGGTATGSGFIVDQDGHIITNNHVIEGAASLKVTFSDGTTADATLVGSDPYQDVAVIKVDAPVPATVQFGDSDTVRAGDPVLAIGSALGEFTNTVTNGIVSATDRSLDTGEGYKLANLIQHNAPISPGNSGGPLVDMSGHVIGMNTAVVRGTGQATAEGLGFAVAGNTVKRIADDIIANGSAQLPYLGVTFADAASVGLESGGVVIQEVVDGSPAAEAGLQPGDVITAIDGVTIDTDHPFLNSMLEHKPGDVVQLQVTHENGDSETISVTLGTRPS